MAMPADPLSLLRSKPYLVLLVIAAILGVPISAAAYGFLALVSFLQTELFVHLPHALGMSAQPVWWPVPVLLVGGLLVGLAIRYLPGTGGASPADGFKIHAPPTPRQLAGVILAALATLSFGMVLGPEMPLIAVGGGLALLVTSAARRPVPDQAKRVLGSTGSFAAISTLLGSPLTAAFLLMEAIGLGGTLLELVLLPGLLAAGIGALIFVGLGHLTGQGTFGLGIAHLPPFTRPDVAEFGWAIVIGLAAAVIGLGIRRLGLLVKGYAQGRIVLVAPAAGLAVAALAVIYSEVSGKSTADVLFSGQSRLGPLLDHAAAYSAGVLVLLLVCKGLAYGVSLGSFRGGPIFPSMFLGAAGGLALSHAGGLPPIAGAAMGIGAMTAVMLTLPVAALLLTTLFLVSDGITLMPLVIVAIVVGYVARARLAPPPAAQPSAASASGQPQAQAADRSQAGLCQGWPAGTSASA
jgi:H+/Cl- antiporter ClcA